LIMADCSPSAAQPLLPLFDAMGKQTISLDQPGEGAVMKLAINSLIHGLNQTVSEALSLVEAAGISTKTALEVMEPSAVGAPMLKYRRPLYLKEAEKDVTSTVALARKEMELSAALADQLGAAMPQGRETIARLQDAEARGCGARDMAAILDYMQKEMQ